MECFFRLYLGLNLSYLQLVVKTLKHMKCFFSYFLFRYISYPISYPLKYMIQFLHVQSCATITTIYNFKPFSSTSQKRPLASTSYSLSPAPGNHQSAFCSRHSIFGMIPKMGSPKWDHIICGLCVWLLSLRTIFSKFIHVVVLSVLHSFFWLNNIPLYGYN